MEEWKTIEGYEGMYQVSNLGRVKSLVRFKRKTDKIIQGNPNKQGYLQIQLYKDRKRFVYLVHRLVLMAFGPVPYAEGLMANHKDFDVTNNTIDNLEWVTAKGNSQHYWENTDLTLRKETPQGETHHLAVMTEEKVKELRRLYEENIITNKSELGRMFGIGESTVRQILKRESWNNI